MKSTNTRSILCRRRPVDTDEIVEVVRWDGRYGDHLGIRIEPIAGNAGAGVFRNYADECVVFNVGDYVVLYPSGEIAVWPGTVFDGVFERVDESKPREFERCFPPADV